MQQFYGYERIILRVKDPAKSDRKPSVFCVVSFDPLKAAIINCAVNDKSNLHFNIENFIPDVDELVSYSVVFFY